MSIFEVEPLDAPTARCERDGCDMVVPVHTMHLDHDDDCPTFRLGFCGCRTVCEACCRTCNGEEA